MIRPPCDSDSLGMDHSKGLLPQLHAAAAPKDTRAGTAPLTREGAKLFSVWNWLPAFYAVAQTQHLPTASKRLHVSISAISRTIRLLQEGLGRPLFHRVGRNLELNVDGRRLLTALEASIVSLTSELEYLTSSGSAGPLHVGLVGPLSQGVILSAVRRVQSECPQFVPYLHSCQDQKEALRLLRTDNLDLIFCSEPVAEDSTSLEFLGQFANGVFCGPGHPLFGTATPAVDTLLQHPFVASISRLQTWPAALPRKVAIYVNQDDTALQVCLGGHLLAVLPEVVARPYLARGVLWRITIRGLVPSSLYAVWRTSDQSTEHIPTLLTAVRSHRVRFAAAGGANGNAEIPPHAESFASLDSDATSPALGGESSVWRLGDSLLLQAEYDAARRAYRTVFRHLGGSRGSASLRAAYLLRLARIALMGGRYATVRRHCGRVLSLGSSPSQAAVADSMLAIMHFYEGDTASGEASLRRARSRLRQLRNDSALQSALVALLRAEGSILVARGEPLKALRAYEQGATVCERLGYLWERSIALGNIADAYLHARRPGRALRYFDLASKAKRVIGDRWGMCYVHHGRAFVHLTRGEIDRSAREAADGLKMALGVSDLRLIAMLNVLLGRANLAKSDIRAARRAFRFALTAASRCSARLEIIQAAIGLAETELKGGNASAAWARASEARRRAARSGSTAALAAALYACSAIRQKQGLGQSALALLRRARALVPDPQRFYGFWFTVETSASNRPEPSATRA